MRKGFNLLAYVALLATTALAQAGNSPRADGFHGLILNQTSSEEAIRMLGQPALDKVDRLDVSRIEKWLDPKHKEKIFRKLTFKNVGDFSQIELSFLENKLMMIELDFKKDLSPLRLKNMFPVEFAIVGVRSGPSDLPDRPGKYPVRFMPDYYPFRYNEVGISDKAFIWVDCGTGESRDPGRVDSTRQISRLLERK